jgi:signal transduction histidine kinase
MRQSLKHSQAELLKRERLATIGQMASSVIHDLRNPLATIETAAEMLARDRLPPDRRATLLASQTRASQRMNGMLNELLEFSQGNYLLRRERHSLPALIGRVVHELGAPAAGSGVRILAQAPEELLVSMDLERMRRVLENLCMNSIQAMPSGGVVSIRAAARGAWARVEVQDTGPGVPAQIRERLFEPFVSHGKPGGTGLGLAIAHSIVAAHGGAIGLDPTADRGAVFYIELPLDE